ncbi:MAG: DHH family phosphoesterase [Aigarchaeota archaeon]|nr:DHH family phosphoesterase [Candidatus Pelearchaeum maunauluense]
MKSCSQRLKSGTLTGRGVELSADFLTRLREASQKVREAERACVVFHNDADGLCAASLMLATLEKMGMEARQVCIEKIHLAVVEKIHRLPEQLFIYLDIGSGRADLIAEQKSSGQYVIIVDHHDPREVVDSGVLNVNAELYGYSGESDVSGSTTTYLLARELGLEKHEAWKAVVGSAEIPGKLVSLNRVALDDAVAAGEVEIIAGDEEKYRIKAFKQLWNRLSTTFTLVGSVGYYREGPAKVLGFCKSRRIDRRIVEELENMRREAFRSADALLAQRRLDRHGRVQWFHVGDLFRGMGSKVIGTYTSVLSYRAFIDQRRYLVGFMNYEAHIPGLGEVGGSWVKASLRAPRQLAELIRSGQMPPTSRIAEEAASKVGGTADGHAVAASAIIPRGEEEVFIEYLDKLANVGIGEA